MAEIEQINRHKLQNKATASHFSERSRGQIFGLIVALCGFSVSAWLGYLGLGSAASVIGGVTLLGIVGVFVTGQVYSAKANNQNNAE